MYLRILLAGKNRKLILILFDILCFIGIEVFYYCLADRAAFGTPTDDLHAYLWGALLLGACVFCFRFGFGVYRYVWRYTSTRAYFSLIMADCVGGLMALLATRIFGIYQGIWHAITVASMASLLALLARLSYRLLYKRLKGTNRTESRIRVAIAGAGQLGTYLANDLKGNPNSGYKPMFFIDVDRAKIGSTVSGLRVYSNEDAAELIRKHGISEVIVAITSVDSEAVSRLFDFYSGLGCKVKIFDSLVHEEGDGQTGKHVIREFSIEDLLFRKPLNINDQLTYDYYCGKTVLVTGGGGSIGSEICRQIAKCKPRKLIIFDIYENNAYDIQQELWRAYGETLSLAVEIGSVRDTDRLEEIFSFYRPEVVFHAAAHKHVPLMEHSAGEAIKNNVMGTYNTANMAEQYGVEKFILISTDKAVNPTNVMGASKRICEMIIQCRTDSKTSFAAVRFGNVLGSNGSVIPLFKRQIASGGPVTITDKRIIRYFMTIPEASQLVIRTGAMAKKGELFVLDMGKPVKIYDLAVSMIRLSGLVPGKDIEIKEIGLRPGEKMYEELLMKTEVLDKTENNMIFIERDAPLTRAEVEEKLRILNAALENSRNMDCSGIKAAVRQVVPTFCDPGEVNQAAENAEEMKLADAGGKDASK